MYTSFKKHTLNFRFLAGTSRGVLRHKDSYFIKVSQDKGAKLCAWGECAPLRGLSVENFASLEQKIADVCDYINHHEISFEDEAAAYTLAAQLADEQWPSLRFGLETAFLDYFHGCDRKIMDNPWSESPFQPISINGLVWMSDKQHMLEQLKSKLAEGFSCIKIKIGAIGFEDEIALLKFIRQHYSAEEITIRVDANGAFDEKDVFRKMDALAQYAVHSIEQPVPPAHFTLMRKLCAQSPLAIALDEELIGVNGFSRRAELLDEIRPQYIILKPSLLGGMEACREWIRLAEERNIGWWMTSALESNVGLNAIAQFTATYQPKIPQGLGTGQLYHNNIDSPLLISNGHLMYRRNSNWDFSLLER
jgi:o-succinylbenzoate synthase